MVILAFILRHPLIAYNAPVVAHPDERGTLGLLWRLRTESLNPHFFAYPSFYFYLTSAWVRNAAMGEILASARLLNLLLGCGIGVAAGWITWQVSRSRLALVIATGLVLFSPELVFNASYLAVDALFVLLSLSTLGLWLYFWETDNKYSWIAAAILSGLALGTKYNAVIVLISMILVEWVWGLEPKRQWVNWHLAHRWQIVFPIIGATILAILSLIDPAQLIALLPNRASIDSHDVEFIGQWLTLFRLGAIACLIVSCLIWRFPAIFKRFFALRPYLAMFIALIVFFTVTPFALISWQEFLLDVGTELKKNALSGDQRYWLQYGGWLRQFESLFALLFAPIGLTITMRHRPRAGLLLGSYLLLNYLAIGSASRGFERYLSPLLPVLYLLAAVGIQSLISFCSTVTNRGSSTLKMILLTLILVGIGIELQPKLQRVLDRATTTDYQHAGYSFIVGHGLPDTIHFEGFVPMFELKVHDVRANWVVIKQDTWLDAVGENDLIMVDTERNEQISAETRQSLTLLWSSHIDLGLYIYTLAP